MEHKVSAVCNNKPGFFFFWVLENICGLLWFSVGRGRRPALAQGLQFLLPGFGFLSLLAFYCKGSELSRNEGRDRPVDVAAITALSLLRTGARKTTASALLVTSGGTF
jgi:hypothetical protein